ncbi:hypothetical protein [Streptomyces tsukubensis]|uniref:Regulatory protein n=1 Tax=Streptomyces tsukubensis TaxID=83656 RepID=A0A1V4AG14_9ACTN|nr:hypothetical protein [Streptomyces tsukubensis]OON82618.1 hypothetical protein B1H18_00675 [Streptomyces tsukubensis]QFR92210.1 hypothetical protein GBW32_03015 [Streptomyces tsukubensis]
MSDDSAEVQNLKNQYAYKVATDLEHNTEEQKSIAEEITSLQERLTTLQRDQAMLVGVQQAIGGEAAEALTQAVSAGSQALAGEAKKKTPTAKVPQARKPKQSTTERPKRQRAAEAQKAPAKKKAATSKAEAVEATGAKNQGGKDRRPTLRELISNQLAAHGEPRSASEVAATLTSQHPDREVKGNVVRTTLEALVAKGRVLRTKQQKSVFYTHVDPDRSAQDKQSEPANA